MILSVHLLGVVFYFAGKKPREDSDDDDEEHNLLCRFVVDGQGRTIGESISLEDDVMIIKSKSTYLGVPMKHIEPQEKTLLVKGLIDYDKAIEMGEQWRKESFKEMQETQLSEEE
jgi:hypothetical protein